jgi:hypothetical protein
VKANVDVKNIEKSLILFSAQYGDFPWGQADWGCSGGSWCETEFYSSSQGGEGDPWLIVNDPAHHLSNFYKSDWTGYNASYFVNNGFYYVELWDDNGDGKIGCGYVALYDSNWYCYGYKYILCQDCNYCGMYDQQFQTTPLWY